MQNRPDTGETDAGWSEHTTPVLNLKFRNMKTIFILLLSLNIYSCKQSSSNVSEKKSYYTLNVKTSENDSLKSQILYHGDCSYSLSEPEGWLANGEPPQMNDDIRVLVMYEPNNTINHSAPIGIYSNVIFKENYRDLTLKGFLKGEKETALNRGERIIEASLIKTQDNKTAIIRKYLKNDIGEYFAIAYIDEPKYIIMITYTAKDLDDYNNYYNSFEKIVQSYKYLGLIVKDENTK